jgi:hypothetical protein
MTKPYDATQPHYVPEYNDPRIWIGRRCPCSMADCLDQVVNQGHNKKGYAKMCWWLEMSMYADRPV